MFRMPDSPTIVFLQPLTGGAHEFFVFRPAVELQSGAVAPLPFAACAALHGPEPHRYSGVIPQAENGPQLLDVVKRRQ